MLTNSKRSVALNARLKALRVLWFLAQWLSRMSSLCLRLHKARRLAFPAAKQKKEEAGTSEPCGLKLLMGARCPGAVGSFVKLNSNTLLSGHIKPQAGDTTEIYGQKKKKHSVKLTRGVCFLLLWKKSSGSAVQPRWHTLKIMNVFLYKCSCWFTLLPKFCNLFFFFLIKRNLKMMFFFSVSFLKLVYKLYTGREMGPLFSMLLASGMVHHVQKGESKLYCCHGQDSLNKCAPAGGSKQ